MKSSSVSPDTKGPRTSAQLLASSSPSVAEEPAEILSTPSSSPHPPNLVKPDSQGTSARSGLPTWYRDNNLGDKEKRYRGPKQKSALLVMPPGCVLGGVVPSSDPGTAGLGTGSHTQQCRQGGGGGVWQGHVMGGFPRRPSHFLTPVRNGGCGATAMELVALNSHQSYLRETDGLGFPPLHPT